MHRAEESTGAPAKQRLHRDTPGKAGNTSSVVESQNTNYRSENEQALLCFGESFVVADKGRHQRKHFNGIASSDPCDFHLREQKRVRRGVGRIVMRKT